MRGSITAPCSCLVLLAAAACGAAAEDFRIKLSHDSKAGDRSLLTGTHEIDEETVSQVSQRPRSWLLVIGTRRPSYPRPEAHSGG
jgi:hypothetical protein